MIRNKVDEMREWITEKNITRDIEITEYYHSHIRETKGKEWVKERGKERRRREGEKLC